MVTGTGTNKYDVDLIQVPYLKYFLNINHSIYDKYYQHLSLRCILSVGMSEQKYLKNGEKVIASETRSRGHTFDEKFDVFEMCLKVFLAPMPRELKPGHFQQN